MNLLGFSFLEVAISLQKSFAGEGLRGLEKASFFKHRFLEHFSGCRNHKHMKVRVRGDAEN